MADYNPVAFGYSLRTHRRKLGWSAIQLVALYAEFVGREDSPPNPAFIYHIETGKTLVSQERRAILASLVGMPLALVGIAELDSSMPLDILEYLQALEVYCDQYRLIGTLKQERAAIEERANHLEAGAGLSCVALKGRLLELLGFYQIVLAEAFRGHQQALASALLSSTIEIAKEEQFSLLHVYARTVRAGIAMGRFEVKRLSLVLEPAIRDIKQAGEERDHLPALYAGLLDVRRGLLDAYTARDKKAFTTALHLITKGSYHIGESADDKRVIARLDEEYCMLTRASAYLYAPMGDAKLGLAQLRELERGIPEARGKCRLVRRNQLFALAYLATGDYPLAAAHLEAAIENASEDCIDSLVQIHTRLKNTSYGNDPDIGRIAVKIHQMKYPELFL
jgi:tetratricopeptide (TPR) repeat protein